jgi:hypothetical protein
LEIEIGILRQLETLAQAVRNSGADRKWDELSRLLQNNGEMFDARGHRRKLVIFTEHRDTLNYLDGRIKSLIGKPEAVVCIHGSMGREERKRAQEAFTQDRDVQVLIATDAAGEGINLQRAHLMVNYDLPWNPNRLEQRFGRIHRIGQTEVCHLWNLVARETREGEVYLRLLEKLNTEREALGGQVFDVLGRVTFEDRPLRELLLEAVRYGDKPEVRAKLLTVVENALNHESLRSLIEERSLAHDSMDVSRVRRIRQDMERADARRLQPHFIASFFVEAFSRLGGSIKEREPRRYEVTFVPAAVRNRDRAIGRGLPVLSRYERITFEKAQIALPGKPLAAFVCPGHPLLDATIDLVLERHRDLLKRGTILVDPNDPSDQPRALVYLEHAIQDARTDQAGDRRVMSRQMQFVEVDAQSNTRTAGCAPYLDYRPPTAEEQPVVAPFADAKWLKEDLEARVLDYAVTHLVPDHFEQVRRRKEELIDKTVAAVKDRLTKEINYWDHRAEQLKEQELAGRGANNRLNSGLARQRADDLSGRLQKRLAELEQERKLSPRPPVVVGGAVIIPAGMLAALGAGQRIPTFAHDTKMVELKAMATVIEAERKLGFDPKDVSSQKLGWDLESSIPDTGKLRFIEVKGRGDGAATVTVTRNEIMAALNKPEDFILAVVMMDNDRATVRYARRPFEKEPDFNATSVNYDLEKLLAQAEEPA